ncbi:hypothetical protein [Streptomyces sp. CAU 1734]|uniref:hypothetical protein n=1 Tax=Streptomyces sp. CAU 1734 TaxID=3140360 RepID=UPI003261B4ED
MRLLHSGRLLIPIVTARDAQHHALRAIALHGLAHPATHALLALAATTAARAWDAGHRVAALHPPPRPLEHS